MKIENIRIEILKDTPFDKKGTVLKCLMNTLIEKIAEFHNQERYKAT